MLSIIQAVLLVASSVKVAAVAVAPPVAADYSQYVNVL